MTVLPRGGRSAGLLAGQIEKTALSEILFPEGLFFYA